MTKQGTQVPFRPKLGSMVEWTSQANGNPRTKIGVVIKVLEPNYPPEWLNKEYKTKSRGKRDHESYLVCVPSPDGTEFFWPRVKDLKKASRYFPVVLAKKKEKNLAAFASKK